MVIVECLFFYGGIIFNLLVSIFEKKLLVCIGGCDECVRVKVIVFSKNYVFSIALQVFEFARKYGNHACHWQGTRRHVQPSNCQFGVLHGSPSTGNGCVLLQISR